jgi:flagellar basal-body rod modification protein FlgD
MQVTSTSSIPSSPLQKAAPNTRVPQKTLQQDDFLKLLTVQLAKQDPMKPMEDMSFIGQMAQFTALEQSNQMVKEFSALKNASDFSSASALLGREVTVETRIDGKVTGSVAGIDAADGTPKLIVGGKLFPLSALKKVQAETLPAA